MKLTWTERREWRCEIDNLVNGRVTRTGHRRYWWTVVRFNVESQAWLQESYGEAANFTEAKRAVARWAKQHTQRATAKGAK